MARLPSAQIWIENCPNSDHRDYHVNREIFRDTIAHFDLPADLKELGEEELANLGEVALSILTQLNDVPGITEVWIHRYSVGILKSPIFSWTKVEKGITAAIRKSLDLKRVKMLSTPPLN